MDEFLIEINRGAKELLFLYKEQKGHMSFVRGIEECLENERQISSRLLDRYRTKLENLKFLSVQFFKDYSDFIRYQDIPPSYFISYPEFPVFISHRWQSKTHPDPASKQFLTIKQKILSQDSNDLGEIGVWYDFCCIPQRNENGELTKNEEAEFLSAIKIMHLLPMLMHVVIIFEDSYLDRSWCLCEWLFSTTISPIPLDEKSIVPLGNAIKFRHLALIVLMLKMNNDQKKKVMEGKDEYVIPFLNSLLMKTFRSTEATYSSDKHYLQNLLHRHFWYHLRQYGLRSQMMIGFLLMERYPLEFVEELFRQFLFLSEDPEMEWTRHALIDIDLQVLLDGDELDEFEFSKDQIVVVSKSYVKK